MKSNYFKRITYTDKTQTPLTWHDFNRFLRIPWSILICFTDLSTAYEQGITSFLIIEGTLFLCLLFFEFNQTKWNDNAYFGIMGSIITSFINNIAQCIYFALPAERMVGAFITCVFEFIYYFKRRKLFDGVSMKEAKELACDTVTEDLSLDNEANTLQQRKKRDYIDLRNRLRLLNAPGMEAIEKKISKHILLSDFELEVYQIRIKMNKLYDSINNDQSFDDTYLEAKKMIEELEQRNTN